MPKVGLKMLEKAAEGVVKLLNRLGDVAKMEAVPRDCCRIRKALSGLSPEAVAHQFKTGDVDGTATVLARALRWCD